MTITPKLIVLALLTSLLLLFVFIRRAPAPSPREPEPTLQEKPVSYETKEHTGGNVTVIATPITLSPGKPAQFDIAFETHSVDLNFDVVQHASLTDDKNSSLGTGVWDGSPPGGHHRKGTLSFFTPLSAETKTVTLTFTNIADVPTRSLTWEVNTQ